MRFRALLLALAAGLLCGAATLSLAQTPVAPTQRDVILNARIVTVANTAGVVTLTGVANQKVRVYGLSAYCSAGTSTLTLAEAAVTMFTTDTGAITTNILGVAWPPAPYTAATGATVTVTLATCGGGNTGTLQVFADRY